MTGGPVSSIGAGRGAGNISRPVLRWTVVGTGARTRGPVFIRRFPDASSSMLVSSSVSHVTRAVERQPPPALGEVAVVADNANLRAARR